MALTVQQLRQAEAALQSEPGAGRWWRQGWAPVVGSSYPHGRLLDRNGGYSVVNADRNGEDKHPKPS